MESEREITEEEMRDLVQTEDPNQIARVVDQIIADIGYNVVHGYNDNYGFYIVD